MLGGVDFGSLGMSHIGLTGVSPIHIPSVVGETTVDHHDDGRVDVHFNVGDLRPRETATVGPAYLFAHTDSKPSTTVSWSATSKDTGGIRTGTTALTVESEADPTRAAEIAVADI